MSADVLQSISKNFPELEQEFDKVAAAVDHIANDDSTKINEFKLSVDVSAENKALKQVPFKLYSSVLFRYNFHKLIVEAIFQKS